MTWIQPQQRARRFIDQSYLQIGYITDSFYLFPNTFLIVLKNKMYSLCKLCNISKMIMNDLFVYQLEFFFWKTKVSEYSFYNIQICMIF